MKKRVVLIAGACVCFMLITIAFYSSRNVSADETNIINIEWKNCFTDATEIPGQDLDDGVAIAQIYRSTTTKTHNLMIYDSSTTVTQATQTTNWSYSGSASTLTGHNMMFQNIRGAYSIKSGGHTTLTNSDGSQQITDYFKFIDPSGNISYWYYIEARCTINGTVYVSTGQLTY